MDEYQACTYVCKNRKHTKHLPRLHLVVQITCAQLVIGHKISINKGHTVSISFAQLS